MLARRATTAVCAILSLVIACNSFSSEPVKLSDDQLRKSIVGVWFAEDMRDLKMHVGQRMQYFSDGHFVGDFRISGPGHERYLRSLGVWSVTDGKFSETAEQTSDPEIKFPSFFRYVVSVDSKHMILGLDDSSRTEWWRGKWPLEHLDPTVSSADHKQLFEQLLEMHVSGYREVPDGKGSVSSRLDSRMLGNPPSK